MNPSYEAVGSSSPYQAPPSGQPPGPAGVLPVAPEAESGRRAPAPVVHVGGMAAGSAAPFAALQGAIDGGCAPPAASRPAYRFIPGGLTPLAHAACSGDVDQLVSLIAQGADVNAREEQQGYGQGYTPLLLAAKNGHARVVDALLKAGADVNLIGRRNCGSALTCAAEYGHGDVVALLLRQAGVLPNEARPDGATAFYCAALNGHASVAESLLPLTAVPLAVMNELMVGACRGGRKGIVELLHRRGGMDKQALEATGCLHAAASRGKADIVAYLLDAGVAADAVDQGGMTPLQHACIDGHLAVVEVLLQHPGTAKDYFLPARTPSLLYLAAFQGHQSVVDYLLGAGMSSNQKDERTGRTALMAAADRGRVDIMQVLLTRPDLKLDLVCNAGRSALQLAMLSKERDAAICLLKAGATVALPGKYDYSSSLLCWAIDLGDIAMCRLVLERGRAVSASADVRWDEALTHAARTHRADVVECLLAAGATRSEMPQKYTFALPQHRLGDKSHCDALRTVFEAHAVRASATTAVQAVEARQRFEVMIYGFEYYAPAIAIADLQHSCQTAAALWPAGTAVTPSATSDVQLARFVEFLEPLAPDKTPMYGPRHALMSSLFGMRFLLSIALPVCDCLVGRDKMIAVLAGPDAVANAQQRAVYHAAALSTLKPAAQAEAAVRLYTVAGISADGVKRLGRAARQQFDDLLEMAGEAAALLGAKMIGQIMPACQSQTDNRYRVDAGRLAATLVAAGLIRPLANAVAESWRIAIETLKAMPLSMPPGVTFLQAAQIMEDAIDRLARAPFATTLLAKLDGVHLLTELRAMTEAVETDDTLHVLFQIQVDQLRQYCAQLQ